MSLQDRQERRGVVLKYVREYCLVDGVYVYRCGIDVDSLRGGKTIFDVSQCSGDGCDGGWYGCCDGITNSNAS